MVEGAHAGQCRISTNAEGRDGKERGMNGCSFMAASFCSLAVVMAFYPGKENMFAVAVVCAAVSGVGHYIIQEIRMMGVK
jgi:hypothetical protein